ncbi:hypothetical protein NHX12_033807 [Muraenolepis orangiensis]|uniref:alanine--glyoxylate transaminase n=1 Tax=Muraenolepis orangiensis TaxID=630683 RepID=A0A9Q0E699_9TELE|nr:hypothetical protein NHX12_033807 [Muraenolepis orangiensis]
MSSLSVPKPACLDKPFVAPQRYMFGPGPSNVPQRILEAGANPIIGHMHPEMFEIMSDIKSGIQYAFQTRNDLTFAVSGTGHTAMECALFNALEPGDGVLVAVNGIWGERAADMAERIGIDILYTGSQKVLNAPPGTAPISFSHRACQKVFNRKTKPVSFFLDLVWLANYWGCDDKPARTYHHTGPVSAFYSLRESLRMLAEEGLESSWERHRTVAQYFHAGLENMGLKLFVKDKSARLPTVTTIMAPPGYEWKEITSFIMKTHNLEISGGLGPSVGLVLRVGLMGCNSSRASVDMVLNALKDALKHCHKSKV